jgi:hypothetical protein
LIFIWGKDNYSTCWIFIYYYRLNISNNIIIKEILLIKYCKVRIRWDL